MMPLHIAFFITAHGFGHAARAAAVMAALRRLRPSTVFHVFTTVDAWFFDDVDVGPVHRRHIATDIGVAQKSPLEEDPAETLRRLDGFFPLPEGVVRDLARELNRRAVNLVVADISPVGIAAAVEAGIASVLVENFTWDWIYAPYRDRHPGFARHIAYLAALFERADVHIQAKPVCRPTACHLTVPPVSRQARTPPADIRARLGIGDGDRMVLLSLGGTPVTEGMLSAVTVPPGVLLVAPGGPECLAAVPGVIRLPVHSGYYHPDLIRASDAVIGKAGYSTIAEVHRYGIPFGFVSRPRFREAPVMEAFIRDEMAGRLVPEAEFYSGQWEGLMTRLTAMAKRPAATQNGADIIARFLLARFQSGAGVIAG